MHYNLVDLLGIGNAIVDVIVRVDESFLVAKKLEKGCMRLIDQDTAHALYEEMGPAIESSGGSVANTVAGIAGLGASAAFIGKLCDDQLGSVFRHDIVATGAVFHTAPIAAPASACCLVLVTPDGERTMNTFLGANCELGSDDIDEDAVSAARIVYLEGYLWDMPKAREAILKAVRLAHDAGRMVALNLSDPFCVERHREDFRRLIGDGVDILLANEAELHSLYATRCLDDALHNVSRDCAIAAVTLGPRGCVIVGDGETRSVPAVELEKIVDKTGAGDQFAAGFLFGLIRGQGLKSCGRLGALAAAEVISHFGSRPQSSLADFAHQCLPDLGLSFLTRFLRPKSPKDV
ncbi:MAG: adenosine kinase [Hyphomicrobiales bacterium]